MQDDATPRRHRGRRIAGYTLLGILGAVIVTLVVGAITPWPAAMLIRSLFQSDGAATAAEMQKHAPTTGIDERLGVAYDDSGDADATLDVFRPTDADGELPAIVWVHGGAWISGSSANVDPYLRIIAAEGYTTIGVNYGVGPEEVYPRAVEQLNSALAYIDAHAQDLGVDADRIALAGDSAGAQLASQLAVLTTDDRYARLLGMEPALDPGQLNGIVLNCGVYDLDAMAELDGLLAWGFHVALWAYTGTKGWGASSQGATMSTIDFATSDFPPTYISGGNGDDLTWLQSIPFADALRAQGVPVTELFWPADHEPALPHEYQFHLDRPEAQEALQETLAWLSATVSAQP